MNKKLAKISAVAIAILPMIAYAATVGTVLQNIKDILNTAIPILMILATVVFLWGVITYVTSQGDETKKKTGQSYIIFGLVGLFVMVAIWGLVLALVNTFSVGGTGVPTGPGAL